jgi:hypothetical protein
MAIWFSATFIFVILTEVANGPFIKVMTEAPRIPTMATAPKNSQEDVTVF